MFSESQKKFSYLDEYKIIKTLGAGYHAEVKLGMDPKGNLYAIKKYKKETANLGTLQAELNIMKQLNHQNLVQLVDVRENAKYKREDDSVDNCYAIVLEYVGGGQLFDFVAETGKFSEKVSRTYFHHIMNGLYYMHYKGFAHRDIKPQNILLATDFSLKIADFGFSCLIRGKDGSEILHTKLGTEGYMAPEIPTKNYEGKKVDIFAAGVILFIMYAGHPPFGKASSNDPHYNLLKTKNYSTFWKAHSKRKPVGYFSESFKDLFTRMVAFDPNERPPIEEIANHSWVKKDVCSQAQIQEQFKLRLSKLQKILDKKRQQQEAKRQTNTMGNGYGYRGELEVDGYLMQRYQSEQDKERYLKSLEPQNADDLLLEQNIVYAAALLKNFFRNQEISLEEEEQQEIPVGSDALTLKAIDIKDKDDAFSVVYQCAFEIEESKFTEQLEISAKFGISNDNLLSLCLIHQKGEWLYFKKVAKAIKKLFTYCRK